MSKLDLVKQLDRKFHEQVDLAEEEVSNLSLQLDKAKGATELIQNKLREDIHTTDSECIDVALDLLGSLRSSLDLQLRQALKAIALREAAIKQLKHTQGFIEQLED